MGANNQTMKKKEKEKNIEYFSGSNNQKSNKFKAHKMELKKKIKKNIEYFNIFPNGNILVYNKKKLTIYDKKSFKIIFEYKVSNINNIVILSNSDILLHKEENDYCSMLNISKNIKNIKIELKEKKYEDLISLVKLNNNHIIFYYRNIYTKPSRNSFNYSCFTFIFYTYDSKNSDLIFDFADLDDSRFPWGIFYLIEIIHFFILESQ